MLEEGFSRYADSKSCCYYMLHGFTSFIYNYLNIIVRSPLEICDCPFGRNMTDSPIMPDLEIYISSLILVNLRPLVFSASDIEITDAIPSDRASRIFAADIK